MACNGYVPDFNGTSTCVETARAYAGVFVWGLVVFFGLILLFTWPFWLAMVAKAKRGGR